MFAELTGTKEDISDNEESDNIEREPIINPGVEEVQSKILASILSSKRQL